MIYELKLFVFQCRVLLNLRTTQPFEEVIEDLGHVLKMNNAKRMLTVSNQEVIDILTVYSLNVNF